MADLTIPKGDKGFWLNFTLLSSAGSPYLLTNYTIKLKVWKPGFPDTLAVNGSCDIVVAANGTCKYLVVDGDFDTVDEFVFELELTKTDVQESTDPKTLLVTESG